MMLIICNKNPMEAVNYLIKNTNENFCFKQLRELGKLICSCKISNVFKPINRGKEIQEWIIENPHYTYSYFVSLLAYCKGTIKMKEATYYKLKNIASDLELYIMRNSLLPKNICCEFENLQPKKIVFRYKKGYISNYETNSLIPVDEGVKEYKKYLKWKMKEKVLA